MNYDGYFIYVLYAYAITFITMAIMGLVIYNMYKKTVKKLKDLDI